MKVVYENKPSKIFGNLDIGSVFSITEKKDSYVYIKTGEAVEAEYPMNAFCFNTNTKGHFGYNECAFEKDAELVVYGDKK